MTARQTGDATVPSEAYGYTHPDHGYWAGDRGWCYDGDCTIRAAPPTASAALSWPQVVSMATEEFRAVERRREEAAAREAECAMPYALFAFCLPLIVLVGYLIGWILS